MPLPDFSLPSYLAPPSQAQKEQLKLEQDELKMRQSQMLQQSFQRMQKRATMQQMLGDIGAQISTGVDADQAQLNSLRKFGGTLYDDASQLNTVQSNLEERIRRRKGVEAYRKEVNRLMSSGDPNMTPEKASAQAWALHGIDIDPLHIGPSIGGMARTEEQRRYHDMLDEKWKEQQKGVTDRFQARREDFEKGLEFKYFKQKEDVEQKKEDRSLKEKAQDAKAKIDQSRAAKQADDAIAKDPTIKQLTEDLGTFKARLAAIKAEHARSLGHPLSRGKSEIDKDIKEAQLDVDQATRDIKAREKEIRSRYAKANDVPEGEGEGTGDDKMPDEQSTNSKDPLNIRGLLK